MKKWIPAYSILALLLMFSIRVHAQQPNRNAGMKLSQTEVKVAGKELTGITIKIFNYGDTTLKVRLKIIAEKGLQLVSRDTLMASIAGNDSLFVSVKLFVPANLIAGKDHKVTFRLYDGAGLISEQFCTFKMNVIKQVTLIPQISSIVLNAASDSIRVPLRITNDGNTVQKVNVIARFPSSLQNNGFHNTLQLTLLPFTDTLVYINKRITRDLLQFDVFSIYITGLFLNGDIFGQTSVNVQSLKNIRYNTAIDVTERYNEFYNNSINLSAQNLGSDFANYQVSGGGAIDLPSARLGYNIDATLYQNNINQPFLRNTYLSYESHNMGVSAGNITRNLDVNLNGRGATAFVMDTLRGNRYEGGYIDNSSNLVGPGYYMYDSGRSAWGKFERRTANTILKNYAVYNKDPFMRANNMLIGNELSWTVNRNLRFAGTLSGGTTTAIDDPDNARIGALTAFNMDAKFGKLSVNSANILSSRYYPGLRKGSTVFTQRLAYNFKKANLWTAFSYLNFEPGYVASYINYISKYGSMRVEAGISASILGVSVSLSPVYLTENGVYFLSLDNLASGKMESYRFTTQFNYSKAKQSAYINIETGISNNTFLNNWQNQFKVSGNYRYGIFGLNASYQYGNFYINEILNSYFQKRGQYISYYITPTIQQDLFKKRTKVQLGVSYSSISTSGKSWLLTGRAEHRLSSKTQLFASLARNQYNFNQYQYDYNNLQFGITQKIPNARVGSKNNTLEVVFYKDQNQNGIRDEGDSEAGGQLIYVENAAFLTDKNGKIVYKNLPDGNYKVSVQNKGVWYAPDQHIVLNKKNLKLEIPLSKIATLKGTITYTYNEFSYEVQKEKLGITVLAADENGKVIKTKTDDGGRFTFYLPTGNYTVGVDLAELPEQISCNNNDQAFEVTQNKIENIMFTLSVRSRKIETKKFISTKEREKETIKDRDRDRDKDKETDKQKR